MSSVDGPPGRQLRGRKQLLRRHPVFIQVRALADASRHTQTYSRPCARSSASHGPCRRVGRAARLFVRGRRAAMARHGERRRRARAVPRHAAARGPVLRRLRRSHRARDLRERRDRRCERRVDIGDRHTPSNANVPRRLRLRAIDTPSPLPRPTVRGRARRPSYSQPLWMNSTTEYRRRSSACCRTASTIRDTPSA